ncbi:MAG: 50S ribosomal protein L5 [Candidatus Hydrogenedentota bacterium]
MAPRLQERYTKEILPALRDKFGFQNIMEVPKLEKIVLNMGVGDATQDARMMDAAIAELSQIAGQRPNIRRAKKSIANFKVREGVPIGCCATLRGHRMYEFLDRLITVALPRIRDFRGVSTSAFDRFGNYTLGLREQTIFPEIAIDAVTRVRGLNITFVIKNARSTEESRELLRNLGIPFRH